MAEFDILAAPPIRATRTATGIDTAQAAVRLRYRPSIILQAQWSPLVEAEAVAMALADIGERYEFRVLAPGPLERLLFRDGESVSAALAKIQALREKLGPRATLIDQSHGRVRLQLKGPAAEALLAKGTAVNVSRDWFRPGDCVATLYGPITIVLARRSAETFDIIVTRSFAQALWDDLTHLGREYRIALDDCT